MRVESINISENKGTVKNSISKAMFKENFGIVGDAHAGPGIRQVSLLSKESVDAFKKNPNLKVCIKEGSFGENITTSGIDYSKIKIGDKLRINDVVLQISKIGKECHTKCAIGESTGDCIMPKQGVFAIVSSSGEVKVGDIINLS